MNQGRPEDGLPNGNLPVEGSEQPEVYLLTREDSRWAFSRRDMMGVALAAAAAKAAQAQSCGEGLSHTNFVRDLAFTPDGRTLVSLGNDQTIKYRRMPLGAHFNTLKLTSGNNWQLAISPDGRVLASGSADKTIRLWSLPGGEPLDRCLVDLAAPPSTGQGIRYTVEGVTYTLPCGAPIPPGATCVCNCVRGTACSCVGYTSGGGGGGICTCVPVIYRYPN